MITITQGINGIYPVYNDSYIKFESTLSAQTYAEITVPEYTNAFKSYPDLDGEYLFNLKEIVKAKFNSNGFADTISQPTGWGKSFTGTYDTQDLSIKVYNNATSETLTGTTYEFFKSVKQIDEEIYTGNTAQILNVSSNDNGIDYALTYFEGYPFSFDLQRITSGEVINIKNLNTTDDVTMTATSTDSFKVYVDKGSSNWTTTSYLPIMDIVNRLEIKVDGVFKTNLRLRRVENCNGLYLKWFNNDGGYSYYLFEEFYTDRISRRVLNTIANNSFNNVGSLQSPTKVTGVEGTQSYNVKAVVDANDRKILESLYTSPSVQLYSKQEAYQVGTWFDVQISGNYSAATKKNKNEVRFSIILPELITPRL